MTEPPPVEGLRLAELTAALSLAIDLGMGQPMEQALRTCLLSVRLAECLGLGTSALSEVYYVALLRFLGCTADAHETAAIVGGDELAFRALLAPSLGGSQLELLGQVIAGLGQSESPIRRARLVGSFLRRGRLIRDGARSHCEVAERLSERLGLQSGIRLGVAHALERWDGDGRPQGLVGEAIALPARIVFLMRDVEVLSRSFPQREMLAIIRRRRGGAYDPSLVDVFEQNCQDLLANIESGVTWQMVMDIEARPQRYVSESDLDRALEAFADFVDLKTPYTLGHSRGVAGLAEAAARQLGMRERDSVFVKRVGLVHDLGRVGVPAGIWEKSGPLSESEWERVRLHPYYTERILNRSKALSALALAGMHHERLDGSGYHRAAKATSQPPEARIVAAADVYHALTEPRPQRPASSPDDAAVHLRHEVVAGRLDKTVVDAVLAAAGHQQTRRQRVWPMGLSDREVEVLRLICRGASKREVAANLTIAPATADHHIRNIYSKIGVSTRAGAAIFALEHGLFESDPEK